jgi:hypothetical protein
MSEAREGDTVSLDPLGTQTSEWTHIEFVFLVDIATEEILRASTFEAAAGGRWVCRHVISLRLRLSQFIKGRFASRPFVHEF